MKTNELFNLADTLEKIAEYIDELEAENSTLEKSAAENPKPYKNEVHEKLASIGFSEEEIEAMEQMPEAVMQKVASVADQPWSLGQAAGPKREKTDPFLEFLVG
jgi:Asp-tRNA(Asn)/Glu-tRNA(Gln) amidotransferase C subunit